MEARSQILQNGDNSVTSRRSACSRMDLNPRAGFRVFEGSFLQGTCHTGDGDLSEASFSLYLFLPSFCSQRVDKEARAEWFGLLYVRGSTAEPASPVDPTSASQAPLQAVGVGRSSPHPVGFCTRLTKCLCLKDGAVVRLNSGLMTPGGASSVTQTPKVMRWQLRLGPAI